jgi:riboflavin biosynthesis pyrimidine reductase
VSDLLYNAVSVLHQLPLGGEDLTRYTGAPRLVRATGQEPFDTVADGNAVTEYPDPGEVVWCDDGGVTCRRCNWRQARRTQLRDDTTFHFVSGSPAEILNQARKAVGDLDIRLGGGPTTINEFLQADLVDYLHIVLVPIVLGRGVRLWDGLDGLHERYALETVTVPSGATHLFFTR